MFNIPMVQSLRILEISTAISLLLSPEKLAPFLKTLGIKEEMIDVKSAAGLAKLLG